MMRAIWKALSAGALAVAFTGSGAFATTLHTFDFDNKSNWDISAKTYTESVDGTTYVFDPVQRQNSNNCFDGSCYIETNQGSPSYLTTSPAGGLFDVVSLYFNYQGRRAETIFGGSLLGASRTPITLSDGTAYAPAGGFTIYLASDLSAAFTGKLEQNTGYFITFDRDQFDGIDSFFTQGNNSKQLRIDCVTISTNGTNITDAQSQLGNCAPSQPQVVPLPAAAWFLIAGLGGLAAVARKKRAA
jgi:hypothetical protein